MDGLSASKINPSCVLEQGVQLPPNVLVPLPAHPKKISAVSRRANRPKHQRGKIFCRKVYVLQRGHLVTLAQKKDH
jgi:hypothetical protein